MGRILWRRGASERNGFEGEHALRWMKGGPRVPTSCGFMDRWIGDLTGNGVQRLLRYQGWIDHSSAIDTKSQGKRT